MKRLVLAIIMVMGMTAASFADNNETQYVAALDMSTKIENICAKLALSNSQEETLNLLSENFCEQLDKVSYSDSEAKQIELKNTVKNHLNKVKKVLDARQFDLYKTSLQKAMDTKDLMAYIK